MLRRTYALASIAFAVSLFAAAEAAAAAQRTFVSTSGSDSNPCSIAAPCRGFQAAIVAVAVGGEVVVLDSGGYGPFVIDKSVTVSAPPGIYAGVSVQSPAGSGISIGAGVTDTVALRNLTIVRSGVGGEIGIGVASVGELRIEGLHISGFGVFGFGGLFFRSPGTLTIANSIIEDNYFGVRIAPPDGATATVVIRDSQLTHNAYGYDQTWPGTGITHATITRPNASANSEIGFSLSATTVDRLVLESCVAAENTLAGIYQGSGFLVLSGNSITGNGVGVEQNGGAAQTRGNNTIVQNGTDVAGVLTSIPGGGT